MQQESQNLHRRVSKKTDPTRSLGSNHDEEQSIIRGLLPCVLTIGGLSLILWLLGYFLIPPRHNIHATQNSPLPYINKEVRELLMELKDFQDWMLLGQHLRIKQNYLDKWKDEFTEPELRLRAVLRDWYGTNTDHCWEAVWNALQAIGHKQLAESIATKYNIN